MRGKMFVGVLSIALGSCLSVLADPAKPDPNDVADLFRVLHSGKTAEPVRVHRTSTGFIESVGTPPGGYFENTSGKGLNEETAARAFLTKYAAALANKSADISFVGARVQKNSGYSYVKLSQTYHGIPVFGAGVSMQLNGSNDVIFVMSRIMTDTYVLDTGATPITPVVTADQANSTAVSLLLGEHPGQAFTTLDGPNLTIYDPALVGKDGTAQLTWRLAVGSTAGAPVKEAVFVNAASRAIALRYSLIYEAKTREIYDAQETAANPGNLARSEGQPPTAVPDVNLAYQYYGDTYDFYFNHFGRDSIDDLGMTMSATVRYCPYFDFNPLLCPFQNAYWDGSRMFFGTGFASADDVVAHELTHGVTQYTSQLEYVDESGALNESMSDVFGEFVDLTNGFGTDTPAVRWLLGEDLPIGAIRSMKNPPVFTDYFSDVLDSHGNPVPVPMPDRYLSPYFYRGSDDNGGVHHNSSVNNKLCYLMTDGDVFNGEATNGMGINQVAALYYECQLYLLTPTATYYDLHDALTQAAINLGYSVTDRDNVETAACAVEIIPGITPMRHFRALSRAGSNAITLTWKTKSCGLGLVQIRRKTNSFPVDNSDGTLVYTGSGESFVDVTAVEGTEYFYSIDALTPVIPFQTPLFYRAISGSPTPSTLSEFFPSSSDLSFSQILFSPVGDAFAATTSGSPQGYTNYSNYVASVTKGVTSLPISNEHAISLHLVDGGSASQVLDTPFPYFGASADRIVVYGHGFVTLQSISAINSNYSGLDVANTFSLESHFEIPRIAPLFADLSPRSGGNTWCRFLPDRVVVTFDKVPEHGSLFTNTFQLELFYSGHIRVTYLEVNAGPSVCGLSDGRGIPRNPVTLAQLTSDLSTLGITGNLTLTPIGVQTVTAGKTLTFTLAPNGGVGPPPTTFGANLMPGGATLDPATGVFTWTPAVTQVGRFQPILKALRLPEIASQVVTINVIDAHVLPVTSNLSITPTNPSDGDALTAHYTFSYGLPGNFENGSVLNWYKNGVLVPFLAQQISVLGGFVKGGDLWSFSVTPRASDGVVGAMARSDDVRVRKSVESDIDGDGAVTAVDVQVVVNAALGIDVSPYNADVNGDGVVDALDVQLVINSAVSK